MVFTNDKLRFIKESLMTKIQISSNIIDDVLVNEEYYIRRNYEELLIRSHVWAYKYEPIKIKSPLNWWEHLKQRFAPKFFLKKFPVKLSVTRIQVRECLHKSVVDHIENNQDEYPSAIVVDKQMVASDMWKDIEYNVEEEQ